MTTPPYFAAASSSLVASLAYELIPGCAITISTKMPNARFEATGIFDCAVTTIHTSNLMAGRLTVDGTSQPLLATHSMDVLDRGDEMMMWSGILPTAGNHTFSMEGVINGSGGGGTFQIYSCLRVEITEVI
ncbi:hypothetical protein ACFQ61_02180 [Streptomyces sp. NPDC056500]|uniref:hypothetical protein n=1 Tax=Streptomyces sp. NPDC056500 TaxID=3345840 RepID=UPI0036CE4ECD